MFTQCANKAIVHFCISWTWHSSIPVISNKGKGLTRLSDGSSRTLKSVPSEFHVFASEPWREKLWQETDGSGRAVERQAWYKGIDPSCSQFHRVVQWLALVQSGTLVQRREVQAWYKGILRSCAGQKVARIMTKTSTKLIGKWYHRHFTTQICLFWSGSWSVPNQIERREGMFLQLIGFCCTHRD